MAHPGIPRPQALVLNKAEILNTLIRIDADPVARARVLRLETDFRARVQSHVGSLPVANSTFQKFNTNPFVLMIHCSRQGYSYISEIEHDILPAKLFSSMETSAGRMVEDVALPVYGWQAVQSGMHSANSVLDGMRRDGNVLRLATLKSGPRCLNDEMSKDIADDIVTNCSAWARDAGVEQIDFSYGVLYGTQKKSNKKDWHILRRICEKFPQSAIVTSSQKRWNCSFRKNDVHIDVAVRIGIDWWSHLSGDVNAFIELCTALIRACVSPAGIQENSCNHTISDLCDIVSTVGVPDRFNVTLLQKSQIEWLFFLARHFCDSIISGDMATVQIP